MQKNATPHENSSIRSMTLSLSLLTLEPYTTHMQVTKVLQGLMETTIALGQLSFTIQLVYSSIMF